MVNKQQMEIYLKEGMSTGDISKLTGVSRSQIGYLIQKYNLSHLNIHNPLPPYVFGVIDTPAKAYVLGFLLCDAAISENGHIDISVALRDSCIVEFISTVIGGDPVYRYKYNRDTRIFPKCRLARKTSDITKFIAGPKKEDRHFPRIRQDLELYLMLGVFDADGCITWGYRKDRNRVWQKISIKSSYKILYGVQQFLLRKLFIPTVIHPVKEENCYVLEFSDRRTVIIFLSWLYQNPNAVVLQRKYQKACALRLELEENGEILAFPSQYRAESAEQKGVQTTGDNANYLNNQLSIQEE